MRTKVKYIIIGLLLMAASLLVMMLPSAYPREPVEGASAKMDGAQTKRERSYNLPLLVIDNGGADIVYDEPGWCNIKVIDNGADNLPGDEPVLETVSTIWTRGQSSAIFDKKSYGIELYEEKDTDKKNNVALLGMAKGHDWVLHGPYLDKALVRNRLTYHIARETMFWAPDTRYCEVIINGEYQGIYLVVESPRVNETRIRMEDRALLSGETSYLLQRNRVGTDTTIVNSFGMYAAKTFYPQYVRYPVDDKLTENQLLWITADMSAFERALYSDCFTNNERGYKAYIDMDSFAAYYVITEFSMNKDSGFLSTYCCKDMGCKLRMGPVWDFNNGYDNYIGYPTKPGVDGDGFVMADNNWFARMIQDRDFVDAVMQKYHELRGSVLSTEYIMNYLDETEAYLGSAIQRNFNRWPQSFSWSYLGKDEDGNSRDLKSYGDAIKQLRDFITERGEYLDGNIELLYNGCIN